MKPARETVALWALSLSLLSAACGSEGAGPPVDAGPDTVVTVSELLVTENPSNVLSYHVTWRTSAALATALEVDCGDAYRQTFADSVTRVQHRVFVMGLFEGLSCEVRVHPDSDNLLSGQTTASIDAVGPLPVTLSPLNVDVMDASRMQPGWTLWSMASANEAGDTQVVAIDAQGQYRWYYSPGLSYEYPEPEVMPVQQGVLLGNLRADSQIVSWEGERLWRLDQRAHHDLRLSPWTEGNVLFLSNRTEPCPTSGSVEHSAIEMDMDTGEILWDWWICDYWTPRIVYEGWSHLNAIEPVPEERAVLISSRNQDLLLKVDRDTSEVVWTLGRDGDFTMDPSDHFLRQHAPEIQPDGTILLFDNGLRAQEAANEGLAAREYSRVLQFALTFDTGGQPDRADLVWEYTDEAVFGSSRSEADRLDNGNTLIHYCYVLPDRSVMLREVTTAGEIVWNVTSGPDTASYRSERFAPVYGYVKD